jgi:CspA family cold shock protein
MAFGTIKTLRFDKGFGFISPDNSRGRDGDVFFHSSSLKNVLFDELQGGERVSFDQEPDPRDPSRSRAANVSLADDGAES